MDDVIVEVGRVVLSCWLLLAITAPGCSSPLPVYRMTFTVDYNASSVNPECGSYHAETFLTELVHTHTEDNYSHIEACRSEYFSEPTFKYMARVTIFENKVRIETNMTINSTDTSANSPGNILNCSYGITDALRNLRDNYPQFLEDVQTMEANLKKNCTEAVEMHPVSVNLTEVQWFCPESYTYASEPWRCLPNSTPSSIRPSRFSPTTPNLPLTSYKRPTSTIRTTVATTTRSTVSPTDTVFGDDAWGVELTDNTKELKLTEGQRSIDLAIKVWANRSLVCSQQAASCHVSLDITISSDDALLCRRTSEFIPQVVIGQSSWGTLNDDYCSLEVEGHHDSRMSTNLKLKAVSDSKYDGTQVGFLNLSLTRTSKDTQGRVDLFRKTIHQLPISIEDGDRKATCQSINDPHISTFDGLEYNNYYEGEFILYKHTSYPFKVHAVYQRCASNVSASCNCAVMVQSGDDVIVIDRCLRQKRPIKRLQGETLPYTRMAVQLFLNGQLTPGTKIFSEGDGKKYFVYLPHGAVVKVMANDMLLNAWITASPSDQSQTAGLCGRYNADKRDDIRFPNGTISHNSGLLEGNRTQPEHFILSWRVEIGSNSSLLGGVAASEVSYPVERYCQCGSSQQSESVCGYAIDVDHCDNMQGQDVTANLIAAAVPPVTLASHPRHKRDVHNNLVLNAIDPDPLIINNSFVPPKHKWKGSWNDVIAKDYCEKYIRDDYHIGQLCAQIAAVNFKQEISTCIEDIRITGDTMWANSARDAMKEQCLEEVQRNASLPADIVTQITGGICINDCSHYGQCIDGRCHCQIGHSSADCSVNVNQPPYVSEIPEYGLCDTRLRDCSRVVVYGANFFNSPFLQCHLQEVKVTEETFIPLPRNITISGKYLDFNSVECIMPEIHSYLISISNNGTSLSDPLLFLPYDSVCNTCSTHNISCVKRENSCIIDNKCYRAGESSPSDDCLVCKAFEDGNQWTTLQDGGCVNWGDYYRLPDWAVALLAALGGSLIGVLAGFLLYKCCCKSRPHAAATCDLDARSEINTSPFEDTVLHRNRGLPTFSSDRFTDIHLPQPPYQETYGYNDGQGVENGVDSTTYF